MSFVSFKSFVVLSSLALSISAFADQPKESIEIVRKYDYRGLSIDVQGLGNKILDEAGKSKYLIFKDGKSEYAYSIKRLGSGDVKYIGKQSDIQGLVFISVAGYANGKLISDQLSVYRPSKFGNAIYIDKFDRDERKPYKFDLGIDSSNNLFIINNDKNVTYLNHGDTLTTTERPKEVYKKLVY